MLADTPNTTFYTIAWSEHSWGAGNGSFLNLKRRTPPLTSLSSTSLPYHLHFFLFFSTFEFLP